jgi:subtilisin
MRFRGSERTGAGVVVAIIDSGIDPMDPRVSRHSVSGWNIELSATGHALIGADTSDVNGHGTTMAAAVSAVAPDVQLLSIRIMDADLRTSADLMAAGIETAFRNGANIISLSMGTPNMGKALLLRDTCALAVESGAVVLAAAHPRGERAYPADIPETVGVASHPDCGPDRFFHFDAEQFHPSEWGHLSGKFLAPGYEGSVREPGAYRGSAIATAYMSGVLACIAEAMPKASTLELMSALENRSLTPVPELGYS